MFRGDVPLSLDPKGRLAIPTRYRDRLVETCGGVLVATVSLTERCLVVYPSSAWRALTRLLRAPGFAVSDMATSRKLACTKLKYRFAAFRAAAGSRANQCLYGGWCPQSFEGCGAAWVKSFGREIFGRA